MTAELTRRPDGADRHPWDWYVEQHWVTEVLLSQVQLETDVEYLDPFCGQGHIPQTLRAAGLKAYGTDIVQRTAEPFFLCEHDFLGDQYHLLEGLDGLSIVMNPPFSYQDGKLVRGLAERIIRRALATATHKVCALLPLKWLSSAGRYRLFAESKPAIHILSERPSMPPGDMIEKMGDRAYARGKVDYMGLVWDKKAEPLPHAPTFWIPPRKIAKEA